MAEQPKQPPPAAPAPAPVPFSFPGDRATAPMALEEDSPSAWQRFEDLLTSQEKGFDPTRDMGPDSFQSTQPMGATLPAAARLREAPRAISIAEVMVLARRNNRACPRPDPWMAFHRLLPSREEQGRKVEAPLPLIAGAWNVASPMQKRLRLRDQIEWADRAGVLMAVYDYLLTLPEEHWFHFDE